MIIIKSLQVGTSYRQSAEKGHRPRTACASRSDVNTGNAASAEAASSWNFTRGHRSAAGWHAAAAVSFGAGVTSDAPRSDGQDSAAAFEVYQMKENPDCSIEAHRLDRWLEWCMRLTRACTV